MSNKMYDMPLKDLAIVIERIPYRSENVPVSSLADIMKPNSGRIENISAKSPIIYIERYEKQSCPSFDRHQKLNCQPFSTSQSNPHFRRNSFLKPAANRHEIKSVVSESVDCNSKNISDHGLKKLKINDVCIVLDTNDVSRKLLKIDTSETSCLVNSIDSVEKENIGCSDLSVDVSRNIEKSISREKELLGKISQVVISGEMCAAKTAEIVDLVDDSPSNSVVNIDVETINVDVDSPDITEVTPVITENYQISDDEEPVSGNLDEIAFSGACKKNPEIFQREIVDVDENSVNLAVEINPDDHCISITENVGDESGISGKSNKKVLVDSEQTIIDLDEGTLDQPSTPKISGEETVCVAENLPENVPVISEAKTSNLSTQIDVSIEDISAEPPVANEMTRAVVANRVDGKRVGVVDATVKIEMPSLSKFAPRYLDTASLVKERRRDMKNSNIANNSSSNNSRAGQITDKKLNSVLNKSDTDIDFDVSLGKRLSRSKPIQRYKDEDEIRREQSESQCKNEEKKSCDLKGGGRNQLSASYQVSKTKNNKLSKMINLAEIKRELDENPINIFEGNSEPFGFGPDDINIFESDAAAVSEVSKAGPLPNNNISDMDIEQLKLHYNIRALKVVITDIYRSKSKLDELLDGKVDRSKDNKNLEIGGNDDDSVNVIDENDDDDQSSDTNIRYNDIDSHKKGSRRHRHHPTGKAQSHPCRLDKKGSRQSLPTKVVQQDKFGEMRKSGQMGCEGQGKEKNEKEIKQDGDRRLSQNSDMVSDSHSQKLYDSNSRRHPNKVDDSHPRPANKAIVTRPDKADNSDARHSDETRDRYPAPSRTDNSRSPCPSNKADDSRSRYCNKVADTCPHQSKSAVEILPERSSEKGDQRPLLSSDKYAKDESRSIQSNKMGDSRHSNKDGSSHSNSNKDNNSRQSGRSKKVDKNPEDHKKARESNLPSDDDADDMPLKFYKSKDSAERLKKGLKKSAYPLSPKESGDPREVSESFEETVARKLAERNKRLGITTSSDFSRCRSPSPPRPSRKQSNTESKKSKGTSEKSSRVATAVTTPSLGTNRSSINVSNSKLVSSNKTTKTVSSEKGLGNKKFEKAEKRNSMKIGHADVIQITDRETISSLISRQSLPLLNNSPRKSNSISSQSMTSSPNKDTSNRSGDAPIVHPRPADFMHPSMRMSLLSKKSSVEKSKADSVTNRRSPETSDTATDKNIPHHPSLRLSKVLKNPSANLGDSPSKSQNESTRENVHRSGVRGNVLGVTRPKPRPLSRQIGSRGILLSPQSAKSRRTWESNILLNTSMDSELDVIGISDTESESSSGSALVMTQVFHISSDEGSENEEDDRLDEPVIEPDAINVLGRPAELTTTSTISNSNDLAVQSTASSLGVTSECAAINSMTSIAKNTFECFIIPSDDEDTVQNLAEMRRRRKTSSKNRIETFIAKPSPMLPVTEKNALPPAPQVRPTEKVSTELPKVITPYKKPKIQTISKAKPVIRSVTQRQLQKLTDHFKLGDLEIKAVKLSDKEIERLIKLCTEKPIWNAKDELRRAGLSKYDIERLGVKGLRIKSSSRYTFRQFLKKRQRYDIDSVDSESKKLKELQRRQKLAEKQRIEVIAIRRALLKINARFLNQNRFWTYLDRKERKLLCEP